MRSRWFHKPTLHVEEEGEGKKVSWLELFYDLIFVAAIIQLGDYLSEEVSLQGFAMFALHFVPLWIAWTGFTFFQNRFTVDDFPHRVVVLTKMFTVGGMAIASKNAMDGNPERFALAFAVALGLVTLLYLRAWKQVPDAREYCQYWGGVFCVGAVAFATSALLPYPSCYILWAVGIGSILFAPISKHSRALSERFPIDMEHLSERYGLLTIIVLGESFVKVLSYLTESGHAGVDDLTKGFFNLTLTCSIWWIYFDDVAGAKIKEERGAWIVWLYGHLPLTLAVTAVGVAVKKAIKFNLYDVAVDKYRWLLAGTLALTFLSVAIIDSMTERRNSDHSDRMRVNVRIASVFVVLLLGQVGNSMSAGVFLGLIAAVCVAQVLFDVMMAPNEETDDMHHAPSIAEVARRRSETKPSEAGRPRRALGVESTVRKGAPAEVRQDLYFFFMEGSWVRVIASFVFLYVFLNVVFAGLYMLEPSSIGLPDGGKQSFADAFFFSVQTLSTIGYGSLSPNSDYGHLLVTLEAATGMLFAAMATGLMFAKVSRPTASVLFSDKMILTTRNGKKSLQFRAANARGNEVVDANMSVTVLIEEVSDEGHHFRSLVDLKLRRSQQPMFVLSWTVMHEIDDSPLKDVDWENPEDHLVVFIITMLGHDSTYGSTTHARHMYQPWEVHLDHRFVDVIHELDDGRLMVDLDKFHDVETDAFAMDAHEKLQGGEDAGEQTRDIDKPES